MRLPTEAETLQASAIVVAAPRYMGAFASAIGIEIITYWPSFIKVEIGSGAAMAILEGWAIAFMFRKWRTMPAGSTHWWVLLSLQIALMLALPATATPYLLASQYGQPASEIMPFALLVAWSFVVAAIAPLVLAAVGYADVEQKTEQKASAVKQKEPAKVTKIEPANEQKEPIAPLVAEQKAEVAGVICSGCGRSFAKVQGLNAHLRSCNKELVAANGNGRH